VHIDNGKIHMFPATDTKYRAAAYITSTCGYTDPTQWGIYEWVYSAATGTTGGVDGNG
jgi:hypothetical protein